MDKRIPPLGTAPAPINKNSLIEVAVPDISSSTGFTTRKTKVSDLLGGSRVLKVRLNQVGTADPTEIDARMVDTIDKTYFSFNRDSIGLYYVISDCIVSGAAKWACVFQLNNVGFSKVMDYGSTIIAIETRDASGALADGLMTESYFELEIFP